MTAYLHIQELPVLTLVSKKLGPFIYRKVLQLITDVEGIAIVDYFVDSKRLYFNDNKL